MVIIHAGSTLLLSDPFPHLWLVLTDPKGKDDIIVAVMVRTAKGYTDPTVILEAGDHPFIRHKSSVHYSKAKWFKMSRIQAALRIGKCHLREDMSPKLLQRVRKGLFDSPFTINALKEYCREKFLNQ